MRSLIVLLVILHNACAMSETDLSPEVNKYLRELNTEGLLAHREKRQATTDSTLYRYYVTQCDYDATDEPTDTPSIDVVGNSSQIESVESVLKTARLIHRMVRFMPKDLFARLAETSSVGLFGLTSLPSLAIPELSVVPSPCYANCKETFILVNGSYVSYDCSRWCTNTEYPYYQNFPINYLWAYGNTSRTFVVENNIVCAGFNPSGNSENYLVREFGLTIMTRALDDSKLTEIAEAYDEAEESQIWATDSVNGLKNMYDYFMKATLIWFDGVSTNNLSGMNCKYNNDKVNAGLPECTTVYHMRKYLKLNDRRLYNILLEIYNNNRAYVQSYTSVCDW